MAVTESLDQNSMDNKLANNYDTSVTNATSKVNMDPEPIDFDECLKDSPKFRHSLRDNLAYVDHLEGQMSKAIKQVSNLIDAGRDYVKSQKDFIHSMRSLSGALGSSNVETSRKVNILLETWEEIMRLNEVVIDQSARTVGASFTKFIDEDLMRLREARKSFDKISNEYDQALLKHSQPVKKQQEDAENILIATSTAFTHTSLDLSIQLTTLQSKKGYEILESLLSLTKAHRTYFHQGFDLFEDLQPQLSDMEENLGNMQDEFETLTRNLPSKHLLVHNNQLRSPSFDNKAQHIQLEGYLFKRASNGFRVWNRRWFILKDHKLIYQKRSDIQPIIMEEDLRLLSVRPVERADYERRFCFEIVSPHKNHILQADTEMACKTWISAIQAGINAAFHDTEHESRPITKPIACTETSSVASFSGWSSGFSLKSLQQQATSKLNSLTNLNDSKDPSKSAQNSKGQASACRKIDDCTESDNDDNDDNDQDAYTEGEQGGSYAPLRDCDDDFKTPDVNNGIVSGSNLDPLRSGTKYPASATDDTADMIKKAPEKPQRAYMIILAMPGNDKCADCNAPQPRWASINLGITLCIECAGIHRSLGVHLSKVRSLTLDTDIWSPEIVQLMLSLGNSSVNSAYLACYRDRAPRINADSSREERESWIKDKYLLKRFMRSDDKNLDDSNATDNSENDDPRVSRADGSSTKSEAETDSSCAEAQRVDKLTESGNNENHKDSSGT